MTESTHDLVAAKAARLRELLRVAEEGHRVPGDPNGEHDPAESPSEAICSYGTWGN